MNTKLDTPENINEISALLKNHKDDQEVLLEEFIPGREITVGILDEKVCGITEIVSKCDFLLYCERSECAYTVLF